MLKLCDKRIKCLKFVNPDVYPEAAWGKPHVEDMNTGCCVQCNRIPQMEEKLILKRRKNYATD